MVTMALKGLRVLAVLVPFATAGRSEGAGHTRSLDDGDLVGAHLISQPPGEPVRVCVWDNVIKANPTALAEIEAAVRIWGVYLGRTLTVAMVVVKAPIFGRAPVDPYLAALPERGTSPCPGNSQLSVVLLPTLGEDAHRPESVEYDEVRSRIAMFVRILTGPSSARRFGVCLRRLGQDGSGGGFSEWVSVAELVQARGGVQGVATAAAPTADELVEVMTDARLRGPFGLGTRVPMLRVLLHEIGHAWGICDHSYRTPALCSAIHALPQERHAGQDAVMGRLTQRTAEQLFLGRPDVDAIQLFLKRGDLAYPRGAWPDVDVEDLPQAP